jgi:hypothetical protein
MPMSSPAVAFSSWTAITPGSTGEVALQHSFPDPVYVAFGTSAPANDSKVAFQQENFEKVAYTPITGDNVYVRLSVNRAGGGSLIVYT